MNVSPSPTFVALLLAILNIGGFDRTLAQAGAPLPESKADKTLALKIPEALRLRHEAFHAEFSRATKEKGKVGDAAREIEKLAEVHFAKGKEVFKPLGLLPQLAEGQVQPGHAKAREIAESLRKNLPEIRREHRDLVAGLKKLAEAAKDEGKTEYVRFAERLIWHIQEEEEVLYPAVILVGEYVKEKYGKKP
ncbi:MAG: hypothetical protein K8R36_06080 [Planctomycetales bacterium]|nr:hypothetical protein [Planctomycetales bacterium]